MRHALTGCTPCSEMTCTASAALSNEFHFCPMPKTGKRSQMSERRGSAGFDGTLPESVPCQLWPGRSGNGNSGRSSSAGT